MRQITADQNLVGVEASAAQGTEVAGRRSPLNLSALRDLQGLFRRVNAGTDEHTTLQAVVDGVVEGLGFEVAVVNLVHDPDFVQVVAVAGPDEVTAALLGEVGTMQGWDPGLEGAEEVGRVPLGHHD